MLKAGEARTDSRKKVDFRGDEKKFDGGKDPWDLLPWRALKEIVKVYNYGAGLYGEESWKTIKDPRKRYFAAVMRHLTAWWEGEKCDPESGLNHLAHAGWGCLALLWFDLVGWPDVAPNPFKATNYVVKEKS